MVIVIWVSALCASTWIVAWHLGSHAAIAGAVVMTLVMAGVLAIYLFLDAPQDD